MHFKKKNGKKGRKEPGVPVLGQPELTRKWKEEGGGELSPVHVHAGTYQLDAR